MTTENTSLKNYIGISRDHSGSMSSIARAACADYNANIGAIRDSSLSTNQDTIVSVVECGRTHQGRIVRTIVNSNVTALTNLNHYPTDGGSTPLWDSVGELIDLFEKVPDADQSNVSFLIMAVTDGQDNSSRHYSARSLAEKIRMLQATDRWTFVFRVPRGSARYLVQMGIEPGNILEWDQTERGVATATTATTAAFNDYFQGRTRGETSTRKFYANVADVKPEELKAVLTDISAEIALWPVSAAEHETAIRDFCENRSGKKMLKGAAFYQLAKTETVQPQKMIAIRDKTTNAVYAGAAARQLLGLPNCGGDVKLVPGNTGNYDVFVQSTSVNRKVTKGTQLLYWPNVGVAYTEGRSA